MIVTTVIKCHSLSYDIFNANMIIWCSRNISVENNCAA